MWWQNSSVSGLQRGAAIPRVWTPRGLSEQYRHVPLAGYTLGPVWKIEWSPDRHHQSTVGRYPWVSFLASCSRRNNADIIVGICAVLDGNMCFRTQIRYYTTKTVTRCICSFNISHRCMLSFWRYLIGFAKVEPWYTEDEEPITEESYVMWQFGQNVWRFWLNKR